MSTSSPAARKRVSNPPAASRAALRIAMLQPGMCSASRSDRSTCTGPPGALATLSAINPSPGGAMFGPPTPAYSESIKLTARDCSQCGSGHASSSGKATTSPLARARPRPGVPVVGRGEPNRGGAAARKRTAHLPLQHVGLALLAEPLTVDTDLGEQQWAVPRDVVESRQIGLQTIAFLEIDIEC